jgi:hypothetical protein
MDSADNDVAAVISPGKIASIDRSKTVVTAMPINDVESMEGGDYIPAVKGEKNEKSARNSSKRLSMLLEEEDDTPTAENAKVLKRRIYGLVYHHIWWLIFGLLGAAMVGAAFPIWGKEACL